MCGNYEKLHRYICGTPSVCKKPEESDILPCPALSGIQNSGLEEPDHEMGQTWPALTQNFGISGILG